MRSTIALAAALTVAIVAPAFAEAPKVRPQPVRGVIESFQNGALNVKTAAGPVVAVALAPTVAVAGVVKRELSDIKAGDYVSSAAAPGPDGGLQALEVHIFPEALRGQNEGQVPWDLAPDAVMTNATVEGVVEAPKGRTLKVAYKGRTAEIVVPDDAPVVSFTPLDASALTAGKTVFLLAIPKAEGLAAAQVVVETDGVKPPM
ncbi:hypothetical protein ACFQ4O_04460 [Methylopila musalis]|uniref:DUF5666 domain-containing protein n=1 Tax=Methylopila musalis TaxID=1134781 RepID=A0ABW3Z4Q2_9HYPH